MSSEAEDQQRMTVCAMGLLHRLATAAGGEISINLDDIPAQLPFSFRIANGKGIFVALDKPQPKPQKSPIVQVPASTLNKLMSNGKGR